MKTAHYYASKSKKFIVIGDNGIFTIDSPTYPVKGKAEARKLAIQLDAVTWNF